jgi:hypothetical protein
VSQSKPNRGKNKWPFSYLQSVKIETEQTKTEASKTEGEEIPRAQPSRKQAKQEPEKARASKTAVRRESAKRLTLVIPEGNLRLSSSSTAALIEAAEPEKERG